MDSKTRAYVCFAFFEYDTITQCPEAIINYLMKSACDFMQVGKLLDVEVLDTKGPLGEDLRIIYFIGDPTTKIS